MEYDPAYIALCRRFNTEPTPDDYAEFLAEQEADGTDW